MPSPGRTRAGTPPVAGSTSSPTASAPSRSPSAPARSNAEIATAHHVSLATVKTYVSAILTKLDLNNRVQVALLVHDADLDRSD